MAQHDVPAQVPLSRHVLFQSDDLDCAREMVARKFCRHRLEIVGDRSRFLASHHHFMGDMVSLNFIDYGADVVIEPGALQDFYLIQIPIRGFATIRNGRHEVEASRWCASVLNPQWDTSMRWHEGCRHVLVQIRKGPFQSLANRVFDRELPGPVAFDPGIRMADPGIARWTRMVMALLAAVDDPAGGCTPASLAWHLHEQALLEAFLLAQPSNMQIFLSPRPAVPPSRHLRRARDFIRAAADRPITLADIAEVAGCTPRSLQLAFQATYGTTPMRALKDERLRRARHELVGEIDRATVAEVALKWGFLHLGRFAADYRAAFGESPSATLARACPRMSLSNT